MDGYEFDHGHFLMIHVETGVMWKACQACSADDARWVMSTLIENGTRADVKVITKDELLDASIWMPQDDDDDSSVCAWELEEMAVEREKDDCDPQVVLENVQQILTDVEKDKKEIELSEKDRFNALMAKRKPTDVSFEEFSEVMIY